MKLPAPRFGGDASNTFRQTHAHRRNHHRANSNRRAHARFSTTLASTSDGHGDMKPTGDPDGFLSFRPRWKNRRTDWSCRQKSSRGGKHPFMPAPTLSQRLGGGHRGACSGPTSCWRRLRHRIWIKQLEQAKAQLQLSQANLHLAETTDARWKVLLKTASVTEQ